MRLRLINYLFPVVVDEIENANPYKITISTGFGEGVGTDKYDLTVTAIFQ